MGRNVSKTRGILTILAGFVAVWPSGDPGWPRMAMSSHTLVEHMFCDLVSTLTTFRPINRANMGGFQIFLHFLGGNFSLHLHINYLGPPVNYGPFQERFRA